MGKSQIRTGEKVTTNPEQDEVMDLRAVVFDNAGEENLFLLFRDERRQELPGVVARGKESEIELTLQKAFGEMNLGSLKILPSANYKTIMHYHPKGVKDMIPVLFSVSAISGDSNACLELDERYREERWVSYETVLRSLRYSPLQKKFFELICRGEDLRSF